MMSKSTRTATLLLLLAFALGAVAGAGGLALSHRPPGMGRSSGSTGYLARLSKDLDLTPAQRDSVGAILTRFEPRMDSVWQEFRPKFETVRAAIRSDINAQLTPDQQRRYAELLERQDARRRNGKDASNAPR